MKEKLNRTIASVICLSVVLFIVGLILVIFPGMSLVTLGIIAGIFLIINGIVLFALDFKVSKFYVPFDGIITGVLSVVLGVLLLAMPSLLSTIIVLALGLWIILTGINTIRLALAVKAEGYGWVLLMGILDIILGLVLLFNPFESSISLIVLVGIVMMVHSVLNIIDMIVVKKRINEFTKAIESKIKILK